MTCLISHPIERAQPWLIVSIVALVLRLQLHVIRRKSPASQAPRSPGLWFRGRNPRTPSPVSTDKRARSCPGCIASLAGNPGKRLDIQRMVFASRRSRRDILRDRHSCMHFGLRCQPLKADRCATGVAPIEHFRTPRQMRYKDRHMACASLKSFFWPWNTTALTWQADNLKISIISSIYIAQRNPIGYFATATRGCFRVM
jgi:hypothetical protein